METSRYQSQPSLRQSLCSALTGKLWEKLWLIASCILQRMQEREHSSEITQMYMWFPLSMCCLCCCQRWPYSACLHLKLDTQRYWLDQHCHLQNHCLDCYFIPCQPEIQTQRSQIAGWIVAWMFADLSKTEQEIILYPKVQIVNLEIAEQPKAFDLTLDKGRQKFHRGMHNIQSKSVWQTIE